MPTDLKNPPNPPKLRYDPVPLDSAPQVQGLLAQAGLGALDPEALTSFMGRNDNWAGTTSTGAEVFVKQLGGSPRDSLSRFTRAVSFDRILRSAPVAELRSPALLAADEPSRTLAFDLMDGCRSGAELASDEEFDDALSERAGRLVAELHELPLEDHDVDGSPPPMPPMDSLRALPWSLFADCSAAQLEAWGLMQSDRDLLGALGGLRERELAAEHRPSHCDLRLDQFLLSGGMLLLTDWEEFRLADPARDVGGFAGEWLYRAVLGIPKALGAEERFGRAPSHEDVVGRGVEELDRLRPRIEAFCAGYRAVRPELDAGFAARAAGYAGWHLIERMLAGSAQRVRLGAVDRAAAGIGRSALLAPAASVTTLGLGGLS
ncbi:class V lanthionine synthetase subunit LxmK [Kitasatospora sp. NPDC086791]|uniref:class V lanthionine synthetase subunit LxmK n=1 Tax=Kitasatospora sp. NPDC086791 TaxID=3155178 RepID=UPI003418E03B